MVSGAATAVTYSTPELLGAAPIDDPDAPIATARYGDASKTPAAIATADAGDMLAGRIFVAPAEAQTLSGPAAPASVMLASNAQPAKPEAVRSRSVKATPRMTYEEAKAATRPADYGLAGAAPAQNRTAPSGLNAAALIAKAAPSADRTGKSRWFLFAASSGKAFGLNMGRDINNGGWRRQGWSRERLAPSGQVQIGLAWRGVDRQLSIGATKRKLQIMDFSKEDTVFGMTWSIKAKS